jgi:hypothetical protein
MKAPSLPDEESTFLLSLSLLPRCRRVQELCGEGWSLQSIADAYTPPRRRSTVRSWLSRPIDNDDPLTHYTTLPPQLTKPPSKRPKRPPRHRPLSPGIPHPTQIQIARLAPLARRYRSRTPHHSPSHLANLELSSLALDLNKQGVTVSELARAGAVTYRAMKRRIDRELQRQAASL